jgi:tetratricopeptide (TPR) repeat protein
MKSFRTPVLIVIAMLVASMAFAQGSRGSGRLSGKITDEAGKGIAGVEVRAQKIGETQVITAQTNDKGEWALNGLAGGQWNLDFVKAGLETIQRTTTIQERARMPALNLTMTKEEIKEDPGVVATRELQRAETLLQAGKFADARAIYADLIAKHPEVFQLHINMGRAYAMESNNEKAAEHFKQALVGVRAALEKDPQNEDTKTILAFLLQNIGDSAEAAKVLSSMDVTKAKDPTLFINAAIHYINANDAPQAIAMLDKLVAHFPGEAVLVYYRGRAYLAASKWDEARADFEKFVAANPANAAAEIAEAKKLLEQMAKIKK